MAVKKRTLGDDLRDFKAGKVPDGYRDNIKNTTPYVIKNWQHSDGFVGGEDAADNPIYGEVTTSSSKNISSGPANYTNIFKNSSGENISTVPTREQYLSYLNGIRNTAMVPSKEQMTQYKAESDLVRDIEMTGKYGNATYEQLKTGYKSATDGREKEWLEKAILEKSTSDELQAEYDSLTKEYNNLYDSRDEESSYKRLKEIEDRQENLKSLIKDKQHQETAQKNQKKNELYQDYYKDYDYKRLKEESENSRLSDYERAWLKNEAYEKSTSQQLQNELDNLTSDYDSRLQENPDPKVEQEYEKKASAYEELIEKKKYEEKKKAEYDDVIENNIKAKTIMQKYYNLQKYDENLMKPTPVRTIQGFENNKGKSELDAYNYAKNLSLEEREQIKNDFNSLENKDTLYKYYKREREEQETSEKNQILTDYSEEHPVLGSLASMGLNTYGSIEDTVKYAGAGIDKAFGGDGYINPDSTNVAKAQLIREKVSEDMDGVGKFFYNTAMSIGDNFARMPLLALPGGKAMSLALAGTSAGVSSANDVINSGGSLESALWTGAAAGTAEVVFEKIPLDNLIKLKKEGTESVFRAVLNQMKTEGLEELGTDITNAITDGIINGDMSQLALQYQNYIAQGYSEEEARKQIAVDFASQLGQSFAAGAISGGVMSGGTVAINKIGETIGTKSEKRKSASQLGREALQSEDFNVNELINTAKKSDNPKAVNLANSLEKVVEEKGADKVKAVDVGNLLTLTNSNEITYDYSQDLSELTGTDKQDIIDSNFELNGEEKTTKTSDRKVKYTDTKAFGENYPHGLGAKISKTGELINIVGIKCSAKDFNSDDNTVVLLADNGELYDADDITTSITYFNNLFDYAKNFDTMGARVYLSQYEDYVKRSKSIGNKADIAEYSKCFERLYSYGIKGVTYDSIKKSGNFTREINILSAGVAYSAVQSGNNDFKVDTRDKSNKSQKIRIPGESNSISSKVYVDPGSEESVKVTDEQLAILQTVADKTGREIVLTDRMGEITGDENANGGYNPNDGKIYINAEVHDSYMLSVSLHEAVHGVAADNPAEYHALCTFITNYLVAKGENIDNLLDDIKIKWGDSVRSEDAALEELVCQTVMAIATDEAAIKTALSLEENKGILKKVASALKKIAKAAYDFIKGVGIQAHNKQAKPWIDDINALNELAKRLEKAFESTRKLNEQRANATANTETAQKNNTADNGDVKYSIVDDVVDDNGKNHSEIVLLDTKLFKGTPPRYWGKIIIDFVYNNLLGKQVEVLDENGNKVTVEFAKKNDRVTKSGANNSHKVVDKLARKTDNISRLAVAHAVELIEVSEYENSKDLHSHQWLDENGWGFRYAEIMDNKGNIYSACLNIAKTKDGRNILYDINKISNIGHGDVPSNAKSKRGSHINPNVAKNNLSQNNDNVKIKFSYGGPTAKTVNNSLFVQAIEMENSGKNSEDIRQKTGWFRGMDGKWRFEIDDSKMRFYKATKQDINNIEEYKNNKIRYNGLSHKISNNTATAEQQQKFKAAEKYIKEYETSKKLSDFVYHPELFKAYPQLKEVNFYFDTISAKGAYYPDSNAIVINPTLSKAEQRESVIHEIQHAIQSIEGFADGSTMAQWQKNGADSFTAYNNYINTAGEIEARDTASRINLNSEQRKNTRPDIDRKDVVFAKGGASYYVGYTTDNKPVAVINDDILAGVPKSQWVKTVKNTISNKFSDGIPIKGRLIKVNRISKMEYTNSKYSKYLRDNKGNIYEDKFRSANHIDDIVLASTNYINEDLKHKRKDNFKEFARGDVLIRVGKNDYSAKVIIGFTSSNQMVLYDIVDFMPANLIIKKESTPNDQHNEVIRSGMLSNEIISQNNSNVKHSVDDTISDGMFADGDLFEEDGYKKETSQLINTKSPDATSENGSVVVSNSSLLQNGDDVKHSVDDTITTQDIQSLRSIGRKSINDFTSEDIQKSEKWARKFYKELGTKSPFFRAWFGDWRAYDNNTVKTVNLNSTNKVARGAVQNKDTGFNIDVSKIGIDHIKVHLHNSKFAQCIINNLHDITENAVLLDTYLSEKTGKTKHINTSFMHSFYVPVEYDGEKSIIKLYVEEYYNNWNDKIQRRDYDVKKIETFYDADRFGENISAPLYASKNVSMNNISDLFSFVKQYDKEFNPKPVNPVMLNDDGTPKVFYHSTNENFTVFKKGERAGLSGKGIYFSPYQQNIYGRNSMPVYLKIENPMTKANEPDGAREINSSGFKTKIIPDFFEKFPEYDAIIQRDEVVVKSPNQIKSATDNIGTFDGNNSDIRYSKDDTIDDYPDLTALDDEEIKVYNKRGWANQLFTNEDRKLLEGEFAKLKPVKTQRTDNVLGDGSRIVEVNNKIVLIGGTFAEPEIYCVFAINAANETEATDLKEVVFYEYKNYRRNKEALQSLFQYVQSCEEDVRTYRAEDFYYTKGQKDYGERAVLPSNFKNYGYTEQFQDGTGSNPKAGRDVSEIKLAVDDTIIDYLAEEYGKPKSRADFLKILEENPNAAILMMYRNSIETAQKGLYLSESIKLPEESYRKIARKVLIDMGVKVNNYGSAVGRLAESIKHIVEKTEEVAKAQVVSGPGYFRNLFENFAKACSDYVKLSSRYNENYRKNVRDYVNGLISNNVLVVRDDDIELIKKNYGSVTEFRSRMNGKTKVGMAKNGRTGYYIEDVADWVYKKYPKLVNATRDNDGVWHWSDKDGGFRWLDLLVNDYLEPKLDTRVESSTVKGYYEDRQSAGFEVALNAINCVLREKVKIGVNEKRIERNIVKELDNEAKQSTAELKELKWAKYRIEELRKRNSKLNAELNKGMSAIRDEYYEARMKTVERNKLIRKLNKFIKLFENGKSSKNYVPDVLQKPILDVLKMIEMNAGTYKNGKQKAAPKSFDRYTQKVSDIDRAVTELTEKYETLKEKQVSYSSDVEFSLFDINTLGFEEETLEMLKTLQEQVKGKNIYELSAEDLRTIYDTINELDGALRRAVEVIIDGQKTTVQEAALKAVEEIDGLKVKKGGSGIKGTVQMLSNQAAISSLDPQRFSRYISGYHDDYVIRKIINELHHGEKKVQRIKQAGYIKITSVLSKYSNKDVKLLQRGDVIDFDFTDIDTNKRVKVSPSMLMGIYLTVKQEDGLRHIINEDPNRYLSLPDLDLLNKNNPISDLRQDNRRAVESERHRVRLTEDDISHINNYIETSTMLKELCNAIMVVFNEQIATEINNVSLQTQGRKIAVVKNYYPLSVDPDCPKCKTDWEFTSVFKDQRIKNKGFTKNRTYSILPLRIDDAMSVFSKHISETAEYCGLLVPLTNFMKIYRNGSDTDTVKSIIKKTYGEPAIHYINKFIGDLQKSDNTDNNLFLKWQGKYMGAKLLANPGAMIQQFSAFPLANKYFGTKNVAAAATLGFNKIDFDLYAKYTTYLWYRAQGNGTILGEVSKEVGFHKKLTDYLDIMGKVDRLVVGRLLYAAELHVEQTTDLKRGTDAFYKEVVRQFEKCVDETQPNNMVTSKPQFIRNNVMRALSFSAFRSQVMAVGNCIIDSFGEYNARRAEYNEIKTEEAKAAKKEAAKNFLKVLIGAASSFVLGGILKCIADIILRHKYDDIKDEKGNITFANIAWKFADESLENLASSFIWGDKLYEIGATMIDHDRYFGLEVMSVEAINDGVEKAKKGDWFAIAALLIDGCGYPAENMLRYGRSIFAYINDISNGYGEIITKNNSTENNTSYFNFIIVEAKQKGETEKAEHFEQMWKDDLIGRGKTEEQANDTIKTKLVTALAASDDDVEQAALAKANGDLSSYEEHMNKVVAYGFDSVDVKKAVDKVIKNIADDVKNRDLEEKSDIIADLKNQGFNDEGAEYVYKSIQSGESSESEDEFSAFADTSEGEGVAYTYSDAFEYLKNGDRENYERIEQYLIDNNDKTKKDVQSAMRSASRTDKLWKEYFEAQGTLSGGGDPVKLEEYKKILTNIYGSWSTAVTYGRKYQKRMKEKEKKENK